MPKGVLFDIIYINRLVFFEIYNNIIFYYIYISVFLILHKKPLTYCYFVIELKTIETVSKSTLFDIIFFISKSKIEICKFVFLYAIFCTIKSPGQQFYRGKKEKLCWKQTIVYIQIQKKVNAIKDFLLVLCAVSSKFL